MRAKSRRGPTVQLEYLIHVLEIKPWPPSQSLKIVRSVLIIWENGDKSSGSTSTVLPLLEDGRIEFNESFRIPVTLTRDMSLKSMDGDVFVKNFLDFNLYEPRNKIAKGQLLGTAMIDLAEYGSVKEVTSIGVPLSCTRSFGNTAQPILYLKVQPVEKLHSRSSSSRDNLARMSSLDKNSLASVSARMSEEYAEESEFASLTDDDVSSHSSVAASSSFPSPNEEGGSSSASQETDQKISMSRGKMHKSEENMTENFLQKAASLGSGNHLAGKIDLANGSEKQPMEGGEGKLQIHARKYPGEVPTSYDISETDSTHCNDDMSNGELLQVLEARGHSLGVESLKRFYSDVRSQVSPSHDASLSRDRLRNTKSVRSPIDSTRSNGSSDSSSTCIERKEVKVYPAEKRNIPRDAKVQELEDRIKVLEGELREAAAIEISLYSVVAEHGSSISKVHTPARRLSRMYLQSCKQHSDSRRASAARSAVSGLLVVAKACGNDVPRLTFWLSNCVVFRGIICQAFAKQQLPVSGATSLDEGIVKQAPRLIWRASLTGKNEIRNITGDKSIDWDDPNTLASALEKVEAWIFTRIVESVWWQTLTPHMQSSAAKVLDKSIAVTSRNKYTRASSFNDQEQVNLSLELWKNAFKDACERLCPVRGGGHECGCLPVLAKLIMEQCVARLDVAMFNAVLRESVDDIPTDPVSDPISDSRVLPIPAGRSSFGAGAQLKNAIGNWSRWLSDLFGMDDDDAPVDDGNVGDDDQRPVIDSSFRSFHLLKSLSDLMMLPKDMLLSSTIRKEVCPTFGSPLIKRVLQSFVPDEFCPDPVPQDVFKALDDEEDIDEDLDGPISSVPCAAPTAVYLPPSPSSLSSIIGDVSTQSQLRRSGSSLLRRSITSDDELEELDSPLSSISIDTPCSSSSQARLVSQPDRNSTVNVRYQLLRDVWVDGE